MILENPDKINLNYLYLNPKFLMIIKKLPSISIIDISQLSFYEEAIDFLKDNPDKINWNFISKNPAIFKINYNYKEIKRKNHDLNDEIIKKALHPQRMLKLMNDYGEDYIYNCFFDD